MANLNLSEFTEKLFVADADHTFIWDTAASISKRVSRNSWLNSGELTSSAPVTISQTWNQIGTAFTAFKINAVSTASASGSLLADFQVGGVSQFSVSKVGAMVSAFSITSSYIQSNANFVLTTDAGAVVWGATPDTWLRRDGAANTLALRNGAAAQTFRVYNTFPGTGNNEYGEITWDANALYFRPAATGTAAIRNTVIGSSGSVTNLDATVITFRPGGASRFVINSGGLFATNDNQVDIGSSGGNRPKDIYLSNRVYFQNGALGTGTSVIVGRSGGSYFQFDAVDGCSLIGVSAPRINFGGTTNLFPAIKRNAAGLQIRLADDSANATLEAGNLYASGNVGIGTTAPTAPLEIRATAATGIRESLLKCTVSDAGNDAFHIYNGTGVDTRFSPGFSASTFTSNIGFLLFSSQTTSANDSGTSPLMIFQSRLTTSETDPNNGTLSVVNNRPLFAFQNSTTTHMLMAANGNLGIGTTSPTSKLHVAGNASPSITVDNTLATGASQLLFKNTVVTGDTDGIFLNGSTQTGFGGAGSLNIKATTGPLAFHTASVTNALSIAQNGAITYTNSVLAASGSSGTFGTVGIDNTYINQNSLRIFGFTSGLFLLGSAFTNANPALKKNGTSLDIVLADNTGFTSVQDLYRRFGAGSPEGVVTAPTGAVYHNTSGGSTTTFYVKESSPTPNTGWVGK